jgi:IMP cyclohydrolase
MDFADALSEAPYPGRGFLVFRTLDGLCVLYWLTGRSEASKRRTLEARGDDLFAVDLVGDGDDPLRHYRAARRAQVIDVIGNGDHVDQVFGDVTGGLSFSAAISKMKPEPDSLFTPRIIAVVYRETESVRVGAAISDDRSRRVQHVAEDIGSLKAGSGVLLCTYRGDPESPKSWASPTIIESAPTLDEQFDFAWSSLDPAVRVVMAGRPLDVNGAWSVR